jgi:hypothetical protein
MNPIITVTIETTFGRAEFDVKYIVVDWGRKGNHSGHPDAWTPDEPAEFEIISIEPSSEYAPEWLVDLWEDLDAAARKKVEAEVTRAFVLTDWLEHAMEVSW